jgi:hypothetical protein
MTLKAGDFCSIPRGTSVTYRAEEASLVMYVTYPNWIEDMPGRAEYEVQKIATAPTKINTASD